MNVGHQLRVIASRNRSHDQLWLAVVSIASAAILIGSIGMALDWKPQVTIVGVIAFGLSTCLTRSILRALYCLVAALGVSAGLFTLLLAIGRDVPEQLKIEWSWFAYAWWGLIVLFALALRWAGVARNFGLVELVGCWVAIATGLRMSRRIDFNVDLLVYLVHVEDNQAWVGLTTQVSSHAAVGSGFGYLGPLMPTLLALLHQFQGVGLPLYNSTFAAYALAIILVPLVAVGLLQRLGERGIVGTFVFAILMIMWVYEVPFLLFGSYGHLSAMWAFVFLLITISYVAFEQISARVSIVGIGLLLALGAVWFPLTPLAIAGIVALVIRTWSGSTRVARFAIVVVGAVSMWALYKQFKDVIGSGASEGLGHLESALTPLYAAKGGTATIDGPLLLVAMIGLVGFAFAAARSDRWSVELWHCGVVLLAYVGLVFAGSYYLKVDIGYGPTKITFICGFAVVIVLLAIAVRQTMPPRAVVVLAVVMLMGSFVYGGAGPLLARSWPGAGSNPIWLKPVEAVGADQSASAPRGIGCFSNQIYDSYMCTRWASGVTLAGDGPFLDYRLSVINQGDSAATVKTMVDAGVLAATDLILLELPDKNNAWGWDLIREAGRVYGADGKAITVRPTPQS